MVSLLAIWLSWWSSETFLRAQDFISDERLWAYEFSLHPDVPDVIQRRNQSDAPRFGKKIARARMECGMDQALLYQDYLSGARLLLRSLTWALASPPQEGEAEAAWEKVQAERFSSFQKGLAALTIDAPLFQARVDALSGSPETMQASIEVALASCDGCEQARARAIEVCLSAGQFQLARTYANTQQLQLRIDQQQGLANAALAQPPLVAALIQARRFTELGEPARAAAEVLPFFEEIRQIPDPELRQAASMILQNGGEVQLALELNPSQTGMAPLAPKRDEEFLPDSCALPSERAAPLLPRLLR